MNIKQSMLQNSADMERRGETITASSAIAGSANAQAKGETCCAAAVETRWSELDATPHAGCTPHAPIGGGPLQLSPVPAALSLVRVLSFDHSLHTADVYDSNNTTKRHEDTCRNLWLI